MLTDNDRLSRLMWDEAKVPLEHFLQIVREVGIVEVLVHRNIRAKHARRVDKLRRLVQGDRMRFHSQQVLAPEKVVC
jgi:hypothetical protein